MIPFRQRVVEKLNQDLGVQGQRPPEAAAGTRRAFLSLGGPAMLETLLHTPVMSTESSTAVRTPRPGPNAAVAPTRPAAAPTAAAAAAAEEVGEMEEAKGHSGGDIDAETHAALAAIAAAAEASGLSATATSVGGGVVTDADADAGAAAPFRFAERGHEGEGATRAAVVRASVPMTSHAAPKRAEPPTDETIKLINHVMIILTELTLADEAAAVALAQVPSLLPRLFVFMEREAVLDNAVALTQELFAAGPDLFSLESVLCLDGIVKSLDPRALSLFCRTIAALFSKPEPPSISSLPPPECVPPNLCSACANRALLVEIPMLLPRVVALLKARDPPRRLWPGQQLVTISPHGIGSMLHSSEQDDTWDSFTAPRRRTSYSSEVMVVLPQDQVPPGIQAMPVGHVDQGLMAVNLEAFERELWATLQADLLFVVATLLGNSYYLKCYSLTQIYKFRSQCLSSRSHGHPYLYRSNLFIPSLRVLIPSLSIHAIPIYTFLFIISPCVSSLCIPTCR